jgi:hypothetical protein
MLNNSINQTKLYIVLPLEINQRFCSFIKKLRGISIKGLIPLIHPYPIDIEGA